MRPEFPGEFNELCKEELGLEMTDQEALEHATAILEMFRAICRPLPSQMKKRENEVSDTDQPPVD